MKNRLHQKFYICANQITNCFINLPLQKEYIKFPDSIIYIQNCRGTWTKSSMREREKNSREQETIGDNRDNIVTRYRSGNESERCILKWGQTRASAAAFWCRLIESPANNGEMVALPACSHWPVRYCAR